MDSKNPFSSFDCMKADITKISAALKNEEEDYDSPTVCSNDAENTEPSLECIVESVGGENVETHFATAKPAEFEAPDENFDTALQNCIILKDWIAKSITKVDSIVNEIDEKQEFLAAKLETAKKLQCEEKKKIKYYKPINLFATPYFRDNKGSVPSPNEDSIMKKLNGEIDAYAAPPRAWTAPERKMLRDAVLLCARQQELHPLVASRDHYKNKLEHGIISDEQAPKIEKKLQIIIEEIENIKKKSDEELLRLERHLDWMRIAASMHDINRSPDQCERMWHNYVHPSINKRKWTEEEDNELRRIAEKHSFRDWEQIASELTLSKRTAIQCLQRYQSALNHNMLKSIWTPEDDEELRHVVEACRNGDYIPWNQVSYHIDGRRRLQIVNRWTRSIAPSLKKDPWSPEEDAILLAAVDRYGYKWAKIKDLLPGRSNFSCRERYTNVLAPGVIVGNWTPEEDRLLVKLARLHPEGKWSKIAEHFDGRTDNMCLQRVTRIRKHHPHLFDPDVPLSDIEENLEKEELVTPTHNCKALNTNRENIRQAAEESLTKTIMKVRGYKTVYEAKEALKSMKASRTFLFQLSKELLSQEGENIPKRNAKKRGAKKKHTVKRKRVIRKSSVHTKRPGIKKKVPRHSYRSDSCDETDSDSDTMSFHDEDDDEEEFSERREESEEECVEQEGSSQTYERTEEDDIVDAELDSLFLLSGVRHVKKNRFVYQSARHVAEHKLLKSYLYEALQCAPDEIPDEEESHKIRGVDYKDTLPLVFKNFVSDSSFHEEMPVFPPNRISLETFKFLLLNRRQLHYFLAQNPCEDTHIISLISSQEIYTLVCASCYKRENFGSQSDVVVNMPDFSGDWSGDNIVEDPDEYTKENKLCNGEPSDNGATVVSCVECERLNSLRRDYHLLRKRLFSLFFWPALLTHTEPTDEQKISIGDQDVSMRINNSKSPAKKCVAKKRARSRSRCRSRSRARKAQSDVEQDASSSSVATKSSTSVNVQKPASKPDKKDMKNKSSEVSPWQATRKSPRWHR